MLNSFFNRSRCLVMVLAWLSVSLLPLNAEAQSAKRNGSSANARQEGTEPREIPTTREGTVKQLGPANPLPPVAELPVSLNPEAMLSPRGLSSTMNLFLLLTVLSLAPSILMMTTCFVRFIIVFSLLRQALGTQQMPPNQVLISLSLFLTFMVMAPVWRESYEQGIRPYTSAEVGQAPPSLQLTFDRTVRPIRKFMAEQLSMTHNDDMLWMFIDYQRPQAGSPEARNYKDPTSYDEVSISALLPAYMLSELKTSFIIGFQLYLPFLVIDMVISAILISMGMMMLPPVMISLPFKLLLFVLVDGWALSVGRLLQSVHG